MVMDMILTYVLFAVGIYLLIKSADFIVDSSSSIAKKFGVSSLIIGLTVVAFGTSLPELVVNVFAAINGSGGLSFGNIIGSNIANVLLILGITAVIGGIVVKKKTVWKEVPFALLAAFALFAISVKTFFGEGSRSLGVIEGSILLVLFAAFMVYVFVSSRKERKSGAFVEDIESHGWKVYAKLILGLVGIYFGGLWVVDGAVAIAGQLGLSEFLISATIIALGTSLPELVVCVVAALKKNVDMAVGNVVGSNIFNILWVFGIIPFIRPITIPKGIGFDLAVMFFATLALFVTMFIGKRHEMTKRDGWVFILLYVLYIAYIVVRG
ncbi:calcium/sodium antiporter [archaeon]|nr:calcium/sodium antiporter [archaeon]